MRPALVTLVPMLAAAGLVLVGGERLAREEVETRIPADRERLLSFADALENELDRLDALYLSHLDQLAAGYALEPNHADLRTWADALKTPRSLRMFTAPDKTTQQVSFLAVDSRERLPEIVLQGDRPPLNAANAVIIPRELLAPTLTKPRGWLPAPHQDHHLYWTRPDLLPETSRLAAQNDQAEELLEPSLVALVVDWTDLHAQLRIHLETWISAQLDPIEESGERMKLTGPSDELLALTGADDRGPAALIMPIRTSLGSWHLQAWDGITSSSRHDAGTFSTAGILSAILALGGLFLYLQQRRALQLAEERVSFVNRVSHELGTPLTNVALNLDLAADSIETRPSEARRRLGIVTEEIERLARLVANVLTFSRRERRTLEIDPQPCIPDDVIAQTLDSFRPALRRRKIEIEWERSAGEQVRINSDALEQIVGNLISNVEKYAYDGGWLGMSSVHAEGMLCVTVADRGPGIPAASRELIFQAFERIHKRVNEGSSGTGLGLTIARELANRMGGSLNLLESETGTHFQLRLPAPKAFAVVSEDQTSAA